MQIGCNCGAVYEVIQSDDPIRDQHDLECVLCKAEIPWSGTRSAQLRLVKHPDTDRE